MGSSEDICHKYRLFSINGCAAGSTFWTNKHRPYVSAESGKTGSCLAMELLSVTVRKPDCTQRAVAFRFNQLGNDGEHFRQRGPSKNQP